LNGAIINTSFPFKSLIFDIGIVQQMITPNVGVLAGANFNQDSRDVSASPPIWAAYYQNVIKYTNDVMQNTKDVATRNNLYHMSRIFQAYAYMVLTDEYGDIPYSEAGKGYSDQFSLPKYETVQPIGNALNGSEAANVYLAKPFVDYLKNTSDPRLSAIAIRYVGATNGSGQTVAVGTKNAAQQIGMPMGKDNGTIVAQATADGLASFYDYSQADRRRIIKATSPVFLVTAAQTNLLLAEARFRGWISTGTASQYFSDGVKAHMDQMATYDAGSAISAGERDAYVSANPLAGGSELQQINTQYWIASFLNGPEAFANFRRSGFPILTPNPYGQPSNPDVPNGTFIRRLTYPTSELSVNTTNVNAAIAEQGPDNLSTRVWWDKP